MNRNENYIHYEADDFLKDSYFIKWMRNEDPQVNLFWERWQKEHPRKEQAITEARKRYHILISFDPAKPLPEEYKEVWEHIERHIDDTAKNKKKIYRIRLLEWAAAVMVLVFAGGWLIHKHRSEVKEKFVIIQSGNKQREITLSDSSIIFMDSYTTLKYHPGNGREFWLNGQAFFDIKHQSKTENAAVSFIVHAGIENITVLGTSFTVKSTDSAARVVLIRGRVKASVGERSVIMKPGEKTTWRGSGFSSERVNPQLYLAWKNGEFHFDHTSLKELAELIKSYYGYDLIVKNRTALKTKTISGTVPSGNEEILWKTLAVMFHAKVTKEGNRIILTIK